MKQFFYETYWADASLFDSRELIERPRDWLESDECFELTNESIQSELGSRFRLDKFVRNDGRDWPLVEIRCEGESAKVVATVIASKSDESVEDIIENLVEAN